VAEPAPATLRLEPLRLQLQGLVDRMQALMMARAVSPVAREGGDCAAAVFLPDGRLLAQARSLPLLLGSLIPAVAGVLARFPAETMAEGDGYLLNDPWSGGSHLPDLVLLQPVFSGARLLALAATILHHQDIGGISPGSVPPDASSIFDEGLRLPPLQSHRAGQLDATLEAVLRGNSRTPDTVLADLGAQWAAGELAVRELPPIAARAAPHFASDASALIDQAAGLTRAALAAEPDGEWHWADALDSDGLDSGPVPLRLRLAKRGDRLTLDFSGSAPQTRGPVNASASSLLSAALFFMRTLAPEAPNNAGGLQALELVLPEGSIVNPRWPAALNARTATVKLACNAMLAAWGQRSGVPQAAAHAGVATVLSVGGERADGQRYFWTEIIASGAAGHADGPGAPGLSTDVGNARNLPVERLETLAPVRLMASGQRHGSGGAGRHAGGDGLLRDMLLLEGRAEVSYRGERHLHPAPGQAGGAPGACARATLWRADGRREVLGSRARFEWCAGDRLCIETAGGGGWGPALASPDHGIIPPLPKELP
jgi:N-methylhydantoinase B